MKMAKTQFGDLTREGKVINSMEIDLSKVRSDDPLAYAYGFFHGKSGKEMEKHRNLAKEYIRGYNDGKNEAKQNG